MAKYYSSDFYEYINSGSLRSARIVVPEFLFLFSVKSVLDVGCGAGAWCKVWEENGVSDVLGIDGSYVDSSILLIDKAKFMPADLRSTVRLGRKFDLVVSLEVAEHIPLENADEFARNLVSHGDIVLFSAAVPGQGGEYHVNEQPLEYWRGKFDSLGFDCFDPIRGRILNNQDVESWYRYNILVYIKRGSDLNLTEEVKKAFIDPKKSIPDVSPLIWRIRNMIISFIPVKLQNTLVMLKHWWVRRNYKGI